MRFRKMAISGLVAASVAIGLIGSGVPAAASDSPVTVQASWRVVKYFPYTEQGKTDCLYLAGTYINPPGRCLEGDDGGGPFWATWAYL